jgi:hypothetical protein
MPPKVSDDRLVRLSFSELILDALNINRDVNSDAFKNFLGVNP